MIKIFNGVLIAGVLAASFFTYSLEHSKRGVAREIAQLKRDIADEKENIKLMSAEWSSLTRPNRIQELAAVHLNLKPLTAEQFAGIDDLSTRLKDRREVAYVKEDENPLGDFVKSMDE